ncbi:MAG: ABC transporter substrate-binding protein [Blastopirellula sp.]|nr:MAG: ABC transporter substrate-binding protein [Blastopirellula sp.]
MNYRKYALTGAALMGLTVLSAPASAGKADDTLKIGLRAELQNMDAYFNTDRVGIIVARHVWDNLLYRDPADFSYKPALAKSYKWVDDVTLEFELRKGIKFHNGEVFDADDVVYTLNFVSNPENKVKNQRNVSWIKNAEKIDPYRVRIHLKKPFPAALDFIAGPLPIYPNEYYAKVGPEGMNAKPIGTGLYRVVSVEPGKEMVFEKNPDYFAESPKGQPSIGKLVFRTIPDTNTAVAELMTGGIDWLWKLSRDQGDNLKSNPNLVVTGGGTMRIGYLQMDAAGRSGDHPLKDVRVRRAIAHAINRKAIVDHLLPQGANVVNPACYPKQMGCTNDVTSYAYDPKKAKALLAEAGYPDGFSIPFDAYRNRNFAEAMIGDLRTVGIKTELRFNKYAPTRDNVSAGKSTMNFMTWGSYSINDISAITSHFFKKGPSDLARDDDVAKWLEAGDTSVDPAVRNENYTKALKKIADQAYWLSLWNYAYVYAFNKDLDFTPTADEIPRFFTARWK